jgi:hypothetical protein
MVNLRVVLSLIGTFPKPFDLLASSFVSHPHAVVHAAALDSLPYMLSVVWVYDEITPLFIGQLDASRYLDEFSHGLPIYKA